MYHELGMPGRKPFLEEPGYTRYVVRESDFRQQLQMMKESGMRGLSVGEALAGTASQEPGVVITFDDGCETDFLGGACTAKSEFQRHLLRGERLCGTARDSLS